MAVRLSALHGGRALPPEIFSYSIILKAEQTPGAMVQPEESSALKKSMTSSRVDCIKEENVLKTHHHTT
jgi:hypothetical protein